MFRLAFAGMIAAALFGGGSAMVSVSPGPAAASSAVESAIASAASVSSPEATISLAVEHRAGGLVDVTAVIEPNAGEARTLLLQMYDGEEATLALPGYPDTRYHVRRSGNVVTARIDG